VDANALTTSTLTNNLTSGHAALAQGTSMLKMIFALDATISVQHAVDLEPVRLVSLMQHLPLEFAFVHQGSIWRMAHALSAWMAVRAVRKGQLVPCVKMASYLRKIRANVVIAASHAKLVRKLAVLSVTHFHQSRMASVVAIQASLETRIFARPVRSTVRTATRR
jgi:hypothetical protein